MELLTAVVERGVIKGSISIPIDIEKTELIHYVDEWMNWFKEGGGPIILKRRGESIVAIISIADLQLLQPIIHKANERVVEAALTAAQMQVAGIEYLEDDDELTAVINGLQL